MAHLLRLDSSARPDGSVSRAITGAFADAWSSVAGTSVTWRNLHNDSVPHLPHADLHCAPPLRPTGATISHRVEEFQLELVGELIGADVLLVGAPLYNYTLPSTLKAWLDHVHVLGMTAPFLELDTQPLAGRPAIVVSARGATYDDDAGPADHARPVLDAVLGGAMGMELTYIGADATLADLVPAMAPLKERAESERAAALATAAELGERLAREAVAAEGAAARGDGTS
ncbi:FMN-dependent NADH-azoreductase [Georgenia sp. Z1344]|uniref:FMN-dependent NADH-azoreductase n=1 Tax=Georgenia sp. Z1344 TaxID=3416706 RepID=UPI003CF83DCE